MKRVRRLCVTGIDGSGKSSLCRRLVADNASLRLVTIWDLLEVPAITSHYRIEKKEDLEGLLAALHFPARLHFLYHCLSEALFRGEAEARDGETLLLDAYWYKYAATEVALGADLDVVRSMGSHFPSPDQIILIDVPVSVARSRKAATTDYEEGLDRFDSFDTFQTEAAIALTALLPESTLSVVDGSKPEDEVYRSAISLLRPG